MYHFYTASKDSTIYLQQPDQNAGLDEILEISKIYYGNIKDVSRALIKFNVEEISQSIASGIITMSYAELILREAQSDTSGEIPTNFNLYLYPISTDWDMGIGTRFDEISSQGVTWNNSKTGIAWESASIELGITGSYNGRGGTWYTSSEIVYEYEYTTQDMLVGITDMMYQWISGSIENNGLIIKFDSEFENDTLEYGVIKYFSKETNTIYQPKLRIGWDDSVFQTGSLTELDAEDIHISFKRLKETYKIGSTVKVKVFGRELYPLKTYSNLYGYTDVKYLPPTTYYQVKDAITDEIIIPFSDFSKVSCDGDGNYFKINFNNWEINRRYYFEIKVERDGVIDYFPNKNQTFEVVI
jgi:hypothetical protein